MRQTVDIGIDLGTTNSAVAVVEGGRVHVLKDDYDNRDTLPSCVAFDSGGSVYCGELARNALLTDPENAFEGFKRFMGTSWRRTAPATGVSFGPEELSGFLLQELRRRAAQWLNEEPTEAVITVPAAFGEIEKHAVTQAANLAGFLNVHLVQEPVAAGLAYGWDRTAEERAFLVYDMGGGTFDSSLMQCVGGQLVVLGHLGEHTLGGRDMDDKIAEQVVAPRLRDRIAPGEYNEKAMRVCCEEAKVRLSNPSLSSAQILLAGKVLSIDGKPMDDAIPLAREQFESVVLPLIDNSIGIVLRLLKDAGVNQTDLASVILVGGPTRMPVLRQRLQESLAAPILTRIDPMTVVAQGAALYAASIARSTSTAKRSQRASQVTQITLAFDPVTSQPSIPVGVAGTDSPLADGTAVRLRRRDGLWDSGLVKLPGGKGIIHVMLAEDPVSIFSVELIGVQGESIPVEPAAFQVTRGLMAAPPPLSRAIGVLVDKPDVLSGDDPYSIEVIAHRGEPTPLAKREKLLTTRPLKPGSTEAVLNVGFFEGPHHEGRTIRPERFRKIGVVPIRGSDLDRALPVGTEVEITLRISASHEALARVYVPSIGKYFEGNLLEFSQQATQTAEELEFRVNKLAERLDDLEKAAVDVDEVQARVAQARSEVGSARSSGPDTQARAVTILEGIEIDADSLEEREAPRLSLEEMDGYLALADEMVTGYGEPEHLRRLEQLRRDAERARSRQDVDEARAVRGRLIDLAALVYWTQPGAWVQRFQELAAFDGYEEPGQASGLILRGREALEAGDLEVLRRVVLDLISLTPQTNEPGSLNPFSIFAGLRRAR